MTSIIEAVEPSSLISLAQDDAMCLALCGIELNQAMVRERVGILCTQIDIFLLTAQWKEVCQSIVDAYQAIVKIQSLYGLAQSAKRLECGLYPSLA